MNITIKKKGTAQNFSGVKHIEVPSQDSGSVEWIPEEGLVTGVRLITQNGIYRASDDGLAGYSGVVVAVQPTKATGANPDDGQRYTVTRDEFGNLLYLPVE